MEPWQSWAVVLVGGSAAWYYYNAQNNRKEGKKRAEAAASRSDPRSSRAREDGGKGRRGTDGSQGSRGPSGSDIPEVRHAASSSSLRSDGSDGSNKARKRKGNQAKGGKSPLSSAVETTPIPQTEIDLSGDVDEVDNREFAKQLADLKKGTTLAPPQSSSARPRTMKQSRSQGAESRFAASETSDPSANPQDASTTSSTTGADADDDLSPAVSPSLKPAPTGQSSTGGGVSDMLEAPSSGPSVLRLTDPVQPPRVQRQREQKAVAPVETKKQRQNRKKAEEKKQAREEAERDRRVNLEKQLRTSREAEGRPARNGMTSASKPPANSAWQQSAKSSQEVQSPAALANGGPLLDTFDPATNASTPKQNGKAVTGGKIDSKTAWERDLPSEEDQLRMINELDDEAGWNTVATGKKNKKKTADTSESASEQPSREVSRKKDPPASTTPSFTGNGFSGNGFAQAADSDWAVV
ncbi:MAG: hypothetical protein M4579_006468 [Chaenotheca gracillima]|nr:MAG: hypothetical protein M4579_006468 [Chaenotheca gracillima]